MFAMNLRIMFADGQVTLTPSERSPLKDPDQCIQLFGLNKRATEDEIEGSGLKEKRKKSEEESEENQLKEKEKKCRRRK
jgi:hypothetical protein